MFTVSVLAKNYNYSSTKALPPLHHWDVNTCILNHRVGEKKKQIFWGDNEVMIRI